MIFWQADTWHVRQGKYDEMKLNFMCNTQLDSVIIVGSVAPVQIRIRRAQGRFQLEVPHDETFDRFLRRPTPTES